MVLPLEWGGGSYSNKNHEGGAMRSQLSNRIVPRSLLTVVLLATGAVANALPTVYDPGVSPLVSSYPAGTFDQGTHLANYIGASQEEGDGTALDGTRVYMFDVNDHLGVVDAAAAARSSASSTPTCRTSRSRPATTSTRFAVAASRCSTTPQTQSSMRCSRSTTSTCTKNKKPLSRRLSLCWPRA